jgi:hypothetical protein
MSEPSNLPPRLSESKPNPLGTWWSRLPTWVQWTIGVVAVFILLGIGGAIGSSGNKEGELKDEITRLEGEVQDAEEGTEAAESEVTALEGKEAEALKAGEEKAEGIVAEARSERSQIESEIGGKKRELASTENQAEGLEAKISNLRGEESEAKEVKAKSTMPGNGTFVEGSDYEAGTWESEGGQFCSWEQDQVLGGEANGEGFNDNYGIGEEHILIEINAPYFKTSECGTWHRVG